MTRVTVRDLRYKFPEIEKRLRRGETLEIRKRQEVLGRLVPSAAAKKRRPRPDFAAQLNLIWRGRVLTPSGADLLRRERDEGN